MWETQPGGIWRDLSISPGRVGRVARAQARIAAAKTGDSPKISGRA